MVKIIHTGDWHLAGNYPEKAAISAQFLIDQIHGSDSPAYNPDVILFGGDLTDRAVHVHSDRLQPFYNLVKSVQCPIVLLQGTHSHEPFGTINNIAALSSDIHVIDNPGQGYFFNGLHVKGLPALTKPLLAQWMKECGSDIDGFNDPTSAIKYLLKRIGEDFAKHSGPKVLVGHWTLSGCMTPTGQTMFGSDLEVGLADLSVTGADAVLLNHIHKSQDWRAPMLVSYSGPPYPTNWGELDRKSFSVLTFDESTGQMLSFERVYFPHLPMVKIEIEFTGQQVDGEWGYRVVSDNWPLVDKNVEVKVCYTVPKEIAAQVDDMYVRLQFAKSGIELSAIDRTIQAGNRERIENITTKQTTRDQYLAVCTAKGEEPRAGSIAKADAIDEQGVPA